MKIAGAIMRGVWVEQRHIADPAVLQAMLAETGLPARRLDDSQSQAVHERYEADSQRAIEAGVFGAPSYIYDGELFWGQDRLDFLERRLARGSSTATRISAREAGAGAGAPVVTCRSAPWPRLTQALLASPANASHFSAATL